MTKNNKWCEIRAGGLTVWHRLDYCPAIIHLAPLAKYRLTDAGKIIGDYDTLASAKRAATKYLAQQRYALVPLAALDDVKGAK